MNTNDRGQNLAERRTTKATWSTHRAMREGRMTTYDPPLPTIGQGDLITIYDDGKAEYVEVRVVRAADAEKLDWESVAGRALGDLQRTKHELERLREHVPADVLREYDRRFHSGA